MIKCAELIASAFADNSPYIIKSTMTGYLSPMDNHSRKMSWQLKQYCLSFRNSGGISLLAVTFQFWLIMNECNIVCNLLNSTLSRQRDQSPVVLSAFGDISSGNSRATLSSGLTSTRRIPCFIFFLKTYSPL